MKNSPTGLLDVLSSIAVPSAKKEIKRPSNRTSEFWFNLEPDSFRERLAPRILEHVDAQVRDRLKTYEPEIKPRISENIDRVREFFLTQLAPLTLAAHGGTQQARDVVQSMLESEVDSTLIDRFHSMSARAASLRLALFVLDYYGLPPEHLENLLSRTSSNDSDLRQIMAAISSLRGPEESPMRKKNEKTR